MPFLSSQKSRKDAVPILIKKGKDAVSAPKERHERIWNL